MNFYDQCIAISKQYFPDNCPLCSGEVLYHKEDYVFRCKQCDASVSAHRKTTKHAKEHEPEGLLGDKEMNLLRKHVYEQLCPLYLSTVETNIGIKTITTAPINIIFPKYCMELVTDGSPKYAYVISRTEDKNYRVVTFDDQEITIVTPKMIGQVSNRTKTYLWLSLEMKMAVIDCKIKKLTIQQLTQASEIITKAIKNMEQMKT